MTMLLAPSKAVLAAERGSSQENGASRRRERRGEDGAPEVLAAEQDAVEGEAVGDGHLDGAQDGHAQGPLPEASNIET
jgi:hypothetical protein